MKNRLLLILLLLTIHCGLLAQSDSTFFAHHLIYLEISGPGGFGSLNYEHAFINHKKHTFAFRCGISTHHVNDYTTQFNPDLIIPLAVNWYYGKNHKLEINLGQTITSIVHANLTTSNTNRQSDLQTIFSVGYRYQKPKGGLFFRFVYNPFLKFNNYYLRKSGLALGYAF